MNLTFTGTTFLSLSFFIDITNNRVTVFFFNHCLQCGCIPEDMASIHCGYNLHNTPLCFDLNVMDKTIIKMM